MILENYRENARRFEAASSSKLGLIGILLILYSIFGQVIYGGVYWGKLKYWNYGNSAAKHLYSISRLQWIFGLFLPLIAPFIINCMIIHSTRSSNCNSQNLQFAQFAQESIQNKFNNFPSQDYFYQRCSKPHMIFTSFLVCLFAGAFIITYESEIRKQNNNDQQNLLDRRLEQI